MSAETSAKSVAAHEAPTEASRLPWMPLLALATAGFLTMLTETLPAGLLPQLSSGLGVSQSTAGQLLSVYAAGSVLAAIPITTLTRGLPRRALLVSTVAAVGATNLVTALSQLYAATLGFRVIGGVAAGVQWAMIAGYAMRLVAAQHKGRALAVSMVGVPLALAFGVPVGTFLGDLVGFRWAFGALGLAAVAVIAWVLSILPSFPGEPTTSRLPFVRVLRTPGLITILLIALLFELAHMTLYTYVAPFLDLAGLGDHVGAVLLLFGIAAIGGLWIAGSLIDEHLRTVVLVCLALFALCMLTFGVAGAAPAAVLVATAVWGACLGAGPTMLQAAAARVAGSALDVAQSMLVTVLNAGMAAGSAVGGLTLADSAASALPWVSFAIFAAAAATAALGRRAALPVARSKKSSSPNPTPKST